MKDNVKFIEIQAYRRIKWRTTYTNVATACCSIKQKGNISIHKNQKFKDTTQQSYHVRIIFPCNLIENKTQNSKRTKMKKIKKIKI